MKKLLEIFFLLSVLLSAACTPQATQSPAQVPTSTPLPAPAIVVLVSPTESNLPPNPAWTEIRDPRFGFGFAVPCWWQVTPRPVGETATVMTLRNYDDNFFIAHSEGPNWKGGIPEGVIKMDITTFTGVDPELTMVDAYMRYVDYVNYEFVSSDEKQVGAHGYTRIILKNLLNQNEENYTVYVTGVSPDTILSFSSYPPEAINSSDAQAIIASFSGVVDEPIHMPTIEPSPALVDASCAK